MKLIDINPNASEIEIPKSTVRSYDHLYDFKTGILNSQPNDNLKTISTYLMSRALADAVNAAIVTGRPLLIKGEPGSGKTKLAQAVASYFFGDEAYKYYFEWHVKSRSKAAEGGYQFDHVARLRDATISGTDQTAKDRVSKAENYVSLGPMGKAFATIPPEGFKTILLIDEIDKGDIDFPNDLLLELDEMRFKINELGNYYIESPKNTRPLVFITSNSERELPPAFLRRCLYYSIPPFGSELLGKIATAKVNEFYDELDLKLKKELNAHETGKFVETFLQEKNKAIAKQPSTSEMLDWLKLLTYHYHQNNIPFEELIKNEEIQKLALKINA